MMKAIEVAKYFLKIQEPDDNITNMKKSEFSFNSRGIKHRYVYRMKYDIYQLGIKLIDETYGYSLGCI